MMNFDSFINFGKIIYIDKNLTYVGDYNSSAKGLSKTIEQSRACGAALVCGNDIIAIECIYPGFESRKRFASSINERGGVVSPFAIKDNIHGTVWYLYRAEERKSYLEPFSGYINVIGKGGFVPLPGDREQRFEWLDDTPATPEDLPQAQAWFFPNY